MVAGIMFGDRGLIMQGCGAWPPQQSLKNVSTLVTRRIP